MELLKNKNAIITGATRGIGKGIALKFAENKANVAFTYISSDEKAKDTLNQLKEFGIKVKAYKFDVSDFKASEQFINDVINNFGKIDIIVNNAGITKDKILIRMTEDDWDDVIKINLKSVFNITKHALKHMIKQRYGSIINISSVVGVRGNAGQSNYAASKSGIIAFSKSIALEMGSRNIRSNVVAPGFIATEMTMKLDKKIIEEWKSSIPLKRIGTPEDVANLCLFLASDLSSYITGQVIPVCGGLLI